jgi:hypothetical protein
MLKIILTVAALTCALGLGPQAASQPTVLTNNLGYETRGPKHAVILGKAGETVTSCALKSAPGGETLVSVPVQAVGPVKEMAGLDAFEFLENDCRMCRGVVNPTKAVSIPGELFWDRFGFPINSSLDRATGQGSPLLKGSLTDP